MIHLEDKTVGNIVTENVNTAKIFHKYKIDFGFNGDIVLKKVCRKRKLDLNKIVLELNSVTKNKYYLKDYNNWNLNLLISFLTDVHHIHKQDDILLLKKLVNEVTKNYRNKIPYINDLVSIVLSVSNDLLMKMNYEETIIYPHIKKIVMLEVKSNNNYPIHPVLSENISTIEQQRLIICEKFKKITAITNDFKVSTQVCDTYKLFFNKLKKFQFYLEEHNHIEKNILLPKALKLEASLIHRM